MSDAVLSSPPGGRRCSLKFLGNAPHVGETVCLMHACLNACCRAASLSTPFGRKKNLQKCSFYISKAACSTPAHLGIPSLQGESLLPSASHLVASSVGVRPPEESLQDNTNPIWKLAGGKGNQLCCEFLFLFHSSTPVHYQNISIVTETPTGIYKKRGKAGCKIYRVPAQFTWFKTAVAPVSDTGWFPTPYPFVRF